jgi:hypothetical protein
VRASVVPLALVSVASPQSKENERLSVLPTFGPLLKVVETLPVVGKQHPGSV